MLAALQFRKCCLRALDLKYQTLQYVELYWYPLFGMYETWSLLVKEGRRLKTFENRVLRKISRPTLK
jgi:hypothetical protein